MPWRPLSGLYTGPGRTSQLQTRSFADEVLYAEARGEETAAMEGDREGRRRRRQRRTLGVVDEVLHVHVHAVLLEVPLRHGPPGLDVHLVQAAAPLRGQQVHVPLPAHQQQL